MSLRAVRARQDRLRTRSGPNPQRPLAARKGALPGKLQEVPAPAGWGQEKLELMWWGQFDFIEWSQEDLMKTPTTAGAAGPGRRLTGTTGHGCRRRRCADAGRRRDR